MDNSKAVHSPRLFIGIKTDVSPNLLKTITHHKQLLKDSKIKWSPIENLHITLRFLGTTPAYYIKSLSQALDNLAILSQPFTLAFTHTGYFGEQKPRVLWLGIEKSQQLNTLFESLADALDQLGFANENRLYMPHLTLGRIKQIADMNTLNNLTKSQELGIPPFTVKQISLFESISTDNGPVYKILHSAILEG